MFRPTAREGKKKRKEIHTLDDFLRTITIITRKPEKSERGLLFDVWVMFTGRCARVNFREPLFYRGKPFICFFNKIQISAGQMVTVRISHVCRWLLFFERKSFFFHVGCDSNNKLFLIINIIH